MNEQLHRQIADLAARLDHVWVATAGADRRPHLATTGRLAFAEGDRVVLTEWFCPATVENARAAPAVAIVVWGGGGEEGFQLLGTIEEIREHGVLDGYDPALRGRQPMPQVRREMIVRVDQVLRFHPGPHTDLPEPAD
ncbi:MAG TPA: pyridoxamine 5'-phosphate oxidase family protein [Phycisphaerae bacterium]|nr:pyridoxamine 5'-phosphate oxidase family protein [Phycisphaerae bacterium]